MTEEFVTSIFLGDYTSYMGIVGWLIPVTLLALVTCIIAVSSHPPEDLPPVRDNIGLITLAIWVPGIIVSIGLLVADYFAWHGELDDRQDQLSSELVIGGYQSAFDLNLESVQTADDATFKYVKDDSIISCEFVGTSDAIKYLVVCHE